MCGMLDLADMTDEEREAAVKQLAQLLRVKPIHNESKEITE